MSIENYGSELSGVPTPENPEVKHAAPGTQLTHTWHYWLGLSSVVPAAASFVLTVWAYYNEGLPLSEAAFIVTGVAVLFLSFTWFWGIYLLAAGFFPQRGVWFLLAHGQLGSLVPLIFMISFGLQLETFNTQPLGDAQLWLNTAGLIALFVQIAGGWF